jgi:hypothetical protein
MQESFPGGKRPEQRNGPIMRNGPLPRSLRLSILVRVIIVQIIGYYKIIHRNCTPEG